MAEISKCVCGSVPVWVRRNKRFIIACPNKACDMNICNYPTEYEAVKNWNEEVRRAEQAKQNAKNADAMKRRLSSKRSEPDDNTGKRN